MRGDARVCLEMIQEVVHYPTHISPTPTLHPIRGGMFELNKEVLACFSFLPLAFGLQPLHRQILPGRGILQQHAFLLVRSLHSRI